MNEIETDLSKARALGSAKSGTHHFWQQRVSALANIPLAIFLIWTLATHLDSSHKEIAAHFANPLVAGAFLLLMISFTWHMRLGLQMVIEDYINTHALKWLALIINQFLSFAIMLIAGLSLIKLGLGL